MNQEQRDQILMNLQNRLERIDYILADVRIEETKRDEILAEMQSRETKKDEIESVKQILKEEMQYATELSIPLEVEVKQGSDWYEAK